MNAWPATRRVHRTLASLPGPWEQLPDCLCASNPCRNHARPGRQHLCPLLIPISPGPQHLCPRLIPMSEVPCYHTTWPLSHINHPIQCLKKNQHQFQAGAKPIAHIYKQTPSRGAFQEGLPPSSPTVQPNQPSDAPVQLTCTVHTALLRAWGKEAPGSNFPSGPLAQATTTGRHAAFLGNGSWGCADNL